jgi:hypothetical protein
VTYFVSAVTKDFRHSKVFNRSKRQENVKRRFLTVNLRSFEESVTKPDKGSIIFCIKTKNTASFDFSFESVPLNFFNIQRVPWDQKSTDLGFIFKKKIKLQDLQV